MTDPGNATNSASGRATVGFQAQVIHGDVNSYVVAADATAREKYEAGVRYLNGGVPTRALQLIEDAIAEGHDDASEVRFYWLLALISGRTFRQFSPEDVIRLNAFRSHPVLGRTDPWADGARLILRLLDSLRLPAADPSPLIAALEDLHQGQKELVLRHLAVSLKGPLGDRVWLIEFEAAQGGRLAGRRAERVELFFLPSQRRPRATPVTAAEISARDRMKAAFVAFLFALALLGIGWLLIRHASVVGMLGYLLACVGCSFAARWWVARRWQVQQRSRRAQQRATGARQDASAGGFAAKVDSRFDWYFATRGPHGADHAAWVSATAGIRRQTRDEIVTIYREQRVSMEQINWLIRYEVEQLASQWSGGVLNEPADHSSGQPAATILRLAAIACAVLGAIITAVSLIWVDAPAGALALLVAAVCGYQAEHKWTGFAVERRREATDEAESNRKLEEREAAFAKWMAKLADNKPRDDEMATWLEHDKKVILHRTLKHYGLKRSEVISYAFLETPGKSYRRASVRNGPWRYSQYKMLVFLLTEDGIRQAAFELRTRDGDIQPQDRHSYRYDAIASVQTSVPRDDDQQTFELHLVNGKTINFRVAEPFVPALDDGTDADALSKATEDATGLRNTLRILEGVAADGKEWIARESQLQDAS